MNSPKFQRMLNFEQNENQIKEQAQSLVPRKIFYEKRKMKKKKHTSLVKPIVSLLLPKSKIIFF